jgi:hypothetical protein
MFDLYVEAGRMPTLTKNMLVVWNDAVLRSLHMIQYSIVNKFSYTYQNVLLERLISYFKHTDPFQTLPLLIRRVLTPQQGEILTPLQLNEMFQTVLSAVIGVLDMKLFATYSIKGFLDRIQERAVSPYWDDKDHREFLEGLFKKHQAAERAKLREAVSLYKEELMMAAWKPSRIKAALDAGFNVEDL